MILKKKVWENSQPFCLLEVFILVGSSKCRFGCMKAGVKKSLTSDDMYKISLGKLIRWSVIFHLS